MLIFNSLKDLEDFFIEEQTRGKPVSQLYDAVQESEDVLPRLYLMVTAGTLLVKIGEVSAKQILKDLIEMARTIQNPIRGLFIRYYMLKKLKEIFPDKGTEHRG